MTQPASILVCPNGHGAAPNAAARFCHECGAPFAAAAPIVPATTPAVSQPVYYPPPAPPPPCATCGGNGSKLPAETHVCPACNYLRPLVPNYQLDCSAFQWAQDGSAMATLRSIGPLNVAARYISDRVGRKWIEATFNAVQLGPQQLPQIYQQAVMAARILGMSFMPEVYISGEKMWDAMTYGSDNSAFIVIGTALINNFKDQDLLFLLAREIGHCRAGHGLWKTVLRFLLGESGPRKGLSGGVLSMLSPTHLIGGALEMPLMAWARQSEITADRAGLLAVGDEAVARRVLLSWSLRSANLYRQINPAAWMAQEDDGDTDLTKLSEMISSSTPYVTRRLKTLSQYAHSPELPRYRAIIEPLLSASYWQMNAWPAAPAVPVSPPPPAPSIRVVCPSCKTAMRIPNSVLKGQTTFNVRCPNTRCGKIIVLRQQSTPLAER